MSVGSIGSTSFNPQAMASQMATDIMKAADKDGSGTLSKSEMQEFKASNGGNGPDVDQVFTTYNKSGNGELTQSELQSSIEAEGAKMQAQGGGAPPSGAPPAGGGAKAASSSSSSSSTQSTDVRDLNKDGKVTEAEILLYSIAHPDKTKDTTSSANTQESSASSSAKQSVDLLT
jgi:hypothetical protein